MSNGITKEAVLRAFPEVLQRSEAISALGDVFADYLSGAVEEAKLCTIYPNVDRLPEDALDILSYDFKIDWWDNEFAIAQKRRVFKRSFYVHKHLGTKQSVQEAVASIYPGSEVLEWFEYGGKPYFFKIRINVTDDEITQARHGRVIDNVTYYKSARSVLENVEYFIHKNDIGEMYLYVGFALHVVNEYFYDCIVPILPIYEMLVDELDNVLTDENGAKLAD